MVEINIPSKIKYIMDKICKNGYECYLVGGCVRDWLLGKEPKDFDITTNAMPEEIEKIFDSSPFVIYSLGKKHGTIAVEYKNEKVEITTYRTENTYKDMRHPNKVKFVKNLSEDLKRRDFTINAMAYNNKKGLIDLYGGQNDLKIKVIRAVGNAERRFNEDALRMIRCIRFAARLDFEIDKETWQAIIKCKSNILAVSSERIRDELLLILNGNNVAKALELLKDSLLPIIMPEFKKSIGCSQNHPHHKYDVYRHTVQVVANITKENEKKYNDVLYLTALLHDIGKGYVKHVGKDGYDHFKGHEEYSQIYAKKILERLHLPNEIIKKVMILIKYHDKRDIYDKSDVKKILNLIGKENFKLLLNVKRADAKSQNYSDEKLDTLDDIEKMFYDIINNNECYNIKMLDITGNDLKKLGYTGKEIGKALKTILNMVIDNPELNKKEKIIEIIRRK